MSLKEVLATLAEAPTLLQVAKEVRPKPLSHTDSIAARVEKTVARFGEHTAVIFEGQRCTWNELNALANRYAAALSTQGLQPGDAVSIVMENRIEFLASFIALNKLGAVAALINTNLTGAPLIHCIKITGSKMCLFGEERLDEIAQVKSDPDLACIDNWLFVTDDGTQECPGWARDLGKDANAEEDSNPSQSLKNTLADTALYIFTSGTTGMPKASVITNRLSLEPI